MDPTIHFADNPLRPTRSTDSQSAGGVYPIRSLSRVRKGSFDIHSSKEVHNAEDEDAGLRDERDYKRKQVGRQFQS